MLKKNELIWAPVDLKKKKKATRKKKNPSLSNFNICPGPRGLRKRNYRYLLFNACPTNWIKVKFTNSEAINWTS